MKRDTEFHAGNNTSAVAAESHSLRKLSPGRPPWKKLMGPIARLSSRAEQGLAAGDRVPASPSDLGRHLVQCELVVARLIVEDHADRADLLPPFVLSGRSSRVRAGLVQSSSRALHDHAQIILIAQLAIRPKFGR